MGTALSSIAPYDARGNLWVVYQREADVLLYIVTQ